MKKVIMKHLDDERLNIVFEVSEDAIVGTGIRCLQCPLDTANCDRYYCPEIMEEESCSVKKPHKVITNKEWLSGLSLKDLTTWLGEVHI